MLEQEVAFHLHEMMLGLRHMTELVDRLTQGEPLSGWGARMALEDVQCEFEHLLEHHLAELKPSPAAEELRPAAVGEGEEGLARAVATLRVFVEASKKSLDADPPDLEALEATLREGQALAVPMHALAVILNWKADPEAAASELQNAMIDVEQRVMFTSFTPDTAMVFECPYCHAPISSKDRTYNGFFCDACGTRLVTQA